MNDRSDKFVNPKFKGDILNVLTRQHNKPVRMVRAPYGIMFCVVYASVLSAKHNFTKTLYLESQCLKAIILHLGICLKRDRRPEAFGLSTNYRRKRKPCIFYDLGYCPISGSLDLYHFN